MTAIVWTFALLLSAAIGLFVWRFEDVRAMDVAARLSIALACGLVVLALTMFLASAAGIAWSVWTLVLLTVLPGAVSWKKLRRLQGTATWPRSVAAAFAAVVALLMYGAATARMTIADLLYFWGPKAVHFFHARAIDVEFLRRPHHYLMHPDYPPLVPLVWSAASMVSGDFSYWGAMWSAPILLAAAALAFRGFAAPVIGARRSALFAVLLLAVTGFACVSGRAAGGAEPYLLLFETVALSALTFSRGRAAEIIAAIALAGAVFTKIEGAAFVIAIALALLITGRLRTAFVVAAPAAILFGSWIAFAQHHELLDSYARARRSFHLHRIGYVMYMTGWQISYRVFYLPWVAALAPMVFGRNLRRAALPLLCALASIGYATAFYMTEPEPLWWIQTSAERIMATTLLCFVVASAAMSE